MFLMSPLEVRRTRVGLCLAVVLISAACKRDAAPRRAAPAPPATDVAPAMDAVVTDFRGIVALLAGDSEPGDRQTTVAWLLAEANRDRLDALAARMAADPAAAAAFLDKLEGDASLHDADKLAFRDQLMELPPSPRADQDRAALATIEARYDAEMKKLFGRLPTRGLPDRREAWETYLDFVRRQVSTEALLAAHAAELEALAQGGRGGGALPWRDDKDQVTGLRFADKQVLLTFDDGPSARLTPQVREILARFGVRAVFFEVGRNVAKAADEPRRILASGYAVANHSFTHAFLPKLDPARLDRELGDTNKALEAATKEKTVLFRPPYGARNDTVLKAATALGMKTVLWNVDSMDWADPVPLSIADRVVAQVEKKKRGIILFHDIHERTLEALPLVLGELQKRGYTFLSWDGRDFVAARGVAAAPAQLGTAPAGTSATTAETPNPLAGVHLYRESWAVVVGINAYKSWPRLAYAVNDAQAVREILIRKYGFPADHVTTLLDGEATREKILAALGDNLADGRKVTKDDRVFVFFAGHGVTRKLPSGKSQGFIVPVDAAAESFQSQAISMTNLQDASDAIPAKHVFFVMDACYSGLALTRGGAAGGGGDRSQYLMEITRRQAREVLTAGGGDEQVADNGPGGHSIFTWTLLQGLEGKADLDGDGAITATELAAYVAPGVSSLSRQTPAFGHLAGDEGGDLVFVLKPEDEFLSEESRQLDAEAIVLNTELEKVRHEVAVKKARNEELKRELAAGGAVATGAPDAGGATAVAGAPALPAGVTAVEATNDEVRREVARGMSLYREKRYDEAARAFEGVLRLRPGHVMATNNLAFTYFKLGRTADAIVWYEKTIALDPKRAIAYANLGDALVQAGRPADAKRAYQQFLALQPGSKLADGVQKKMALLP
jgi:peptidoglycan/xylan/chitin deacetylase (PgdA/CDA1 family)/uncharacterized caspase-like protein/Flp pilus assembly protein TadD